MQNASGELRYAYLAEVDLPATQSEDSQQCVDLDDAALVDAGPALVLNAGSPDGGGLVSRCGANAARDTTASGTVAATPGTASTVELNEDSDAGARERVPPVDPKGRPRATRRESTERQPKANIREPIPPTGPATLLSRTA